MRKQWGWKLKLGAVQLQRLWVFNITTVISVRKAMRKREQRESVGKRAEGKLRASNCGQVQLEKICCLRARAQRVFGHCGDPEEIQRPYARRMEAACEGVGGVQDSRG